MILFSLSWAWVSILSLFSVIERHPIIMKDPEPWEKAFFELQARLMQQGKVREGMIEEAGLPLMVAVLRLSFMLFIYGIRRSRMNWD